MVRFIRVADVVGDYHGEDGSDGWSHIPPKKEEPRRKEKPKKHKPVSVQPPSQPQVLKGGTSLLKGKQ